MPDQPGAILENLTWPEVREWLDAPVIIPIGAASKEHGPHLPMATDAIVAAALAHRLAERLRVLVAPVIPLGYYPVFRDFAGSQHLRAETFMAVVEDVLLGFIRQGAPNLLLLNTGVSTEAPLALVVQRVFDETGVRPAIADLRELGRSADSLFTQRGGGHADERETSLMLALAPESVRMDRLPDFAEPEGRGPRGFRRPIRFQTASDADPIDFWPTGTSGEPKFASLEKGRTLLEAIMHDLEAGVRQVFPGTTGGPVS